MRKVFSFAHVKVSVTKMLDQVQAGFMTILILQEMSLLSYLYLTYNYYTSARQWWVFVFIGSADTLYLEKGAKRCHECMRSGEYFTISKCMMGLIRRLIASWAGACWLVFYIWVYSILLLLIKNVACQQDLCIVGAYI